MAGSITALRSSAALVLSALVLAMPVAGVARAEDPASIEIVIKDNKFEPSEIRVPAGKRVNLVVKNQDGSAEEFESEALKVEKVIAAGSQGTVRLRPLEPGQYPFIGEFHADTAKGVLIVE